jgi:hypothetical protein
MKNPALPATQRDEYGYPLTEIDPGRITCYGCGKTIFNTRTCVQMAAKLFCAEHCADLTAIRRLRRSGRAMTY